METKSTTTQSPVRVDLFIVDDDMEYRQSLKNSLENEFPEQLDVKVFPSGEAAVEEIKNNSIKPHVLVLDYLVNRPINPASDEFIVNAISTASPTTTIIMIAEEKHKTQAMQALAQGAYDYVVKDKFVHEHVVNAVKKALHPQKV